MTNTLLKNTGCLWKDLSESEKSEIVLQFPLLNMDPNFLKYKFRKALHGKWIIPNAMTIPLLTPTMKLSKRIESNE